MADLKNTYTKLLRPIAGQLLLSEEEEEEDVILMPASSPDPGSAFVLSLRLLQFVAVCR